jgi:hypothetical protein
MTADPHSSAQQTMNLSVGSIAYVVSDHNGYGKIQTVVIGEPCDEGHGYLAKLQDTSDPLIDIHTCNLYLTPKLKTAKAYARNVLQRCIKDAKIEQSQISRNLAYFAYMLWLNR